MLLPKNGRGPQALMGLAICLSWQLACGSTDASTTPTPTPTITPSPTPTPTPSSTPVTTSAPVIATQPQNLTVSEGQSANFSVAATGDPVPTYTWERSSNGTTWAAIGGATSSTYAFMTQLTDNGAQFRAKATNTLGTAVSSAAMLSVDATSSGHTYHLDAINGSDTSGDGSQSKPFVSFDKAMTIVASGDIVIMHNGNYGALVAGRTAGASYAATAVDLFTNWVTFRAAPGETPHVTSIDLGSLNYANAQGNIVKLDIGNGQPQGNATHYLRFEGLIIDDGVSIMGSRYVHIKNCIINRIGDLNGSVYNIEQKPGITTFYGAFVTLEGNEITHVAVGINAAGSHTVIKNNHIHHNSHDGIHVLGGPDWLIEGNRIHDLDDGADDYTGTDPTKDPAWDPTANNGAGASWNRHVDGIQIYDLNGDGSDAVTGLTIRRNLFYHLESMGLMLQDKTDSIPDNQLLPPGRFSNWLIEDNVFGPTGGRLIVMGVDVHGGFTMRHNTVVRAPNDSWTSIYRAMPKPADPGSYDIQMWADSTITFTPSIFDSYRVYNNIFGDSAFGGAGYSTFKSTYAFLSNNFYYGSGNALSNGDQWFSVLPYTTVPGTIDDFLAGGGVLGQLTTGSAVINAGTAQYANEVPDDFAGNPRDAKPDIGAFEAQ